MATGVAPARRQNVADREREARVAELRDHYRAGTYEVDSRAVAVAIVNHHLAANSKPYPDSAD